MKDLDLLAHLSAPKRATVLALAKEHKNGVLSVDRQQLTKLVTLSLDELSSVLLELQKHGLVDRGDEPTHVSLSGTGLRIAKQLSSAPPPIVIGTTVIGAAVIGEAGVEAGPLTTAEAEVGQQGFVFSQLLSKAADNFATEVNLSSMSKVEKTELLRKARDFFEHPAVLELLRRGAVRKW